jgi:flagellar basal-body rod modification protein FlgD
MQIGRNNSKQTNGTLLSRPNGLGSKTPITQLADEKRLGKADFLNLLVTQLKYQDPLEPMKNSEFIAQTAQFSALEQMQELNQNVESQMSLQRNMSDMMKTQYIGKTVQVPGSKVQLADGKPVEIGASLSAPAGVRFEMYNERGEMVSSTNLGMQNAKTVSVFWDGRDQDGVLQPDGAYTFRVKGINQTGESVQVEPLMSGQVSKISYEDNETRLYVNGESILASEIVSASM